MKKYYLLLLFCLFAYYSGFSQIIGGWSYIDAVGATGSYKTGWTEPTVLRTDGDIRVSAPSVIAKRGYAVFDLTTALPPSAIVDSVYVRFNFHTSTAGLLDLCKIYADSLDLSTVTTSATLYPAVISGTLVNSTNWGQHVSTTTTIQDRMPFTGAGITFVQNYTGTIMSVGFGVTGSTNTYTITGESGTTGSTGTIPELQIKYHCPGFSGVSATATPTTMCANLSVLTLTGTATGTALYRWTGPNGYNSGSLVSTTVPTSAAFSGVYTLTVTDPATGCYVIDTTTPVTVKASPTPIFGVASACMGAPIVLVDDSTTGTWAITPATVASITSTGIVTLIAPGLAVATYSFADGCTAVDSITVHLPPPTAITGNPILCQGSVDNLSDGTAGGAWSSSVPTIATVSSAGVVTPVSLGTTIITYGTGCSNAYLSVTVYPVPAAFTVPVSLCQNDTVTLVDASPAGYWSSGTPSVAVVGASTGLVTGRSGGIATISYSYISSGCSSSMPITILPAPKNITGNRNLCIGNTVTLTDTITGGTWSSTVPTIASITAVGVVTTGSTYGTTIITYSNSCGYVYMPIFVDPFPTPILGKTSVCIGATSTLTDTSGGGIWTTSDSAIAYVEGGFGIVYGDTIGTTTITYTLPTGCATTTPVYVVAYPVAITGTFSACPGASAALTDASGGGTFSSSNTNIATVNAGSGVYTGVNAGICNIIYTSAVGCAVYQPVVINPNPQPIFTSPVVCGNVTDTLYDYTPGGVFSSPTPSVTVTTLNSNPDTGIYYALNGTPGNQAVIYYTLLATGCSVSDTILVHPAPSPIITISTPDSSYFYVDSVYLSYQWYQNDSPIHGGNSYNLAFLYSAGYRVWVVDTFGCGGFSSPFVKFKLAANNIVSNNQVKIYPNPTTAVLFINAPVEIKVAISDMTGKLISQMGDVRQIDFSNYASGVYIINIFDKDGTLLRSDKLVKQ